MAGRFLALRNKVRDIPQSRKIRFDSADLAIAGFALRLWKAHGPSDATEGSSDAVKLLQKKLERYRLRTKRAAIRRFGKSSYWETADRWRRFAAWAKYNLLYFKIPNPFGPRRAKFWREQRQQLTQAFATALTERFFEVPSDDVMVKLVMLASRSLKRCRHAMGLIELLRTPRLHVGFLVSFAQKRVQLKRLPGAPIPAWQAAVDRAEAFKSFEERTAKTALLHSSVKPLEPTAEIQRRQACTPVKVAPSKGYTHDGKAITPDIVCDAMAEFLYRAVTVRFGLTREACEQARFLIRHGCLDIYRVPTTATSFNGLLNELCPAEFDGHRIDVIVIYAEWMLKVLLALRQNPDWMLEAFTGAWVRAKHLDEKAAYDGWVASRSNGSQIDAITA